MSGCRISPGRCDLWWLVIPASAELARIIIAMDYDQSGIATTYDEARALTPARRRHWQRLLSAHVDRTAISVVVDLGCGTGRFSETLAAQLGSRVIGLDPSEKMSTRPGGNRQRALSYLGGRQHTSFRSRMAASISCSCRRFITTCPTPAAVARECRRVLRIGGYICIRTGTRENDVVVPNFFPAVRVMLDADLPSRDEIRSNFAAAGLTPRHREIVTEVVAPD